eukprot:TRINITY_DN107_c0_g1_i2.p2 TRINITY_DN107_c0_g1~~TRINITY_DN107_c0_g1_i2.p2  ORF type:complete len:202 (-),score=42.75 TRINITY_DN107_c0_g1_i2:112-717(-)
MAMQMKTCLATLDGTVFIGPSHGGRNPVCGLMRPFIPGRNSYLPIPPQKLAMFSARFIILLVAALCLVAIASAFDNSTIEAPLNTCGGNCPSNDCASCPCGTTPSHQTISSWCAKYSGWSQSCCQCIVSHESGGNANAVNQNVGGSLDVGLWQINTQNWASCSSGRAPCDPNTNLQCAIDVWRWGGNTFKLWSTCGGCGCC